MTANHAGLEAGSYQLLFDQAACPMFVFDPVAGVILEANEAALQLYEYPRSEFLGLNADKLCRHPDRASRLFKKDGWRPWNGGVTEHQTRNGAILKVELTTATVTISRGPAVLVTVRVVKAAREATEQAGLYSARAMQRLIESNVIGILQCDAHGRIIEANQAFLDMVGYSQEDLKANRVRWDDMTPPEYAARDREALIESQMMGTTAPFEKEFLRKDGSRVPVLIGGAAYPDDPTQGVCFILDQTQRQRTERALRESEEKFRRVVESNMIGIIFWNLTGEITDANDAFLTMVGFDREDLRAGRINWRDLTPEEYAECDRRALQEVADKGFCSAFEKEYFRKDGSRVPVLVGAALLAHSADQGVGYIVDLTARQRAEEATRRLALIFANLHDAVILTDLHGRITDLNPAAEQKFGYSKTEVLGQLPAILRGAAHSFTQQAAIATALSRDGRWQGELPFVQKTGTQGICETVVLTLTDERSRPVARLGVFRDITRRRVAELALRESEERHRLIAELTSDYAYTCRLEPDGKIILESMTAGFTRVTGFTLDEIMARGGWLALIHPDDLSLLDGRTSRIFAGEREVNELRIVIKNGETRWIRYSTQPIRDAEGGGLVRLLGAVQDITREKEAELKLQEYAHQLQTLSRRLLEVQEQERRHLARELHDEIGQDLTGLKFYLEKLEALRGEALKEKLDNARRLIRELMAKVRDLSTGLRPSMLDDLGLLPTLMWYFERYNAQTGIQVHFQHDGLEEQRLPARSETAAYRIVQEALTNVARHAGATEAEVGAWVGPEGLRLLIADKGKGFSTDVDSRKSQTAGMSGMKERAQLLGGQFAVDSIPGLGTRITALLPAKEDSPCP